MSKTILAKFKVGSVTDYGNANHEVHLSPVVSGSEENKSFSMYTPSGKIEMLINNPETIGFFEAGSEYFVEFKKVDTTPIIKSNRQSCDADESLANSNSSWNTI